MDGTEGLVRGQKCKDTGGPITIPVGPETLGRIINVIGEPIDERGPVDTDKYVITFALACYHFRTHMYGKLGVLTIWRENPEISV